MPDKVQMSCDIAKVDTEKRIVYGWASVVEKDGKAVVDHQGDIISIDEIEKAAHKFLTDCRVAGDSHITKGVGHLVESVVFSKELQKALDINLGQTGWFVGFKVTSDEVWERVKKGELSMFSIGGTGKRTEI